MTGRRERRAAAGIRRQGRGRSASAASWPGASSARAPAGAPRAGAAPPPAGQVGGGGLCGALAGSGCRPRWRAEVLLSRPLRRPRSLQAGSPPQAMTPQPGRGRLSAGGCPATPPGPAGRLTVGGGLASPVLTAAPLPPAGHRQLRCHHPASGSPLRSPRGDRMAPALRGQRPHGGHRHGSAARPLRRGQRGFPFPATPPGTLPQVTAPLPAGGTGSAPPPHTRTTHTHTVPAPAGAGLAGSPQPPSSPAPDGPGSEGERRQNSRRRAGWRGAWSGPITQTPLSARPYVKRLGPPAPESPRPSRGRRGSHRTPHPPTPPAAPVPVPVPGSRGAARTIPQPLPRLRLETGPGLLCPCPWCAGSAPRYSSPRRPGPAAAPVRCPRWRPRCGAGGGHPALAFTLLAGVALLPSPPSP